MVDIIVNTKTISKYKFQDLNVGFTVKFGKGMMKLETFF